MGLLTKLFGTRSEREIKKIQPLVDKILSLDAEYTALTEEQLKGKLITGEFVNRPDRPEYTEQYRKIIEKAQGGNP